MTAHRFRPQTTTAAGRRRSGPAGHQPAEQPGHGGHGRMMVACCIPMLIIAIVLVATGVASAGFLVFAVGCTAMMALIMRGMPGGGGR